MRPEAVRNVFYGLIIPQIESYSNGPVTPVELTKIRIVTKLALPQTEAIANIIYSDAEFLEELAAIQTDKGVPISMIHEFFPYIPGFLRVANHAKRRNESINNLARQNNRNDAITSYNEVIYIDARTKLRIPNIDYPDAVLLLNKLASDIDHDPSGFSVLDRMYRLISEKIKPEDIKYSDITLRLMATGMRRYQNMYNAYQSNLNLN